MWYRLCIINYTIMCGLRLDRASYERGERRQVRCKKLLSERAGAETETGKCGKRGNSETARKRDTFRQTERARTASCSAVIGLRQTPREEQISPVTFRALLPPTASWDHSKRATALPVNLLLPVTLFQLAHALSLSLSPYYLPSSVRPFIWTDHWSISPFLSSLFTSPLSPTRDGGRRERASKRRNGQKGQRAAKLRNTRKEKQRWKVFSPPKCKDEGTREKERKKKGWRSNVPSGAPSSFRRVPRALCCGARSIVLAFRSAQFEWQAVTDQLPAKASWQAGVTGQEGI